MAKNKPSLLTTFAEQKAGLGHKTMSKDAISWMQEKIKEIRSRPAAIANSITRETDRKVTTLRLGLMYCFYYDAKTKDNLPYWDRFPLIIVLEKYDNGFLGLNLHYLPVKFRIAFLSKLMRYARFNEKDDILRVRITYDILNATRRTAEFKPCLKRYLYGQIRSRVLSIKPDEWDVATMLPLQQFKKARPQTVWKESMEEYRDTLREKAGD
jgi:hypothetical protein